MKIQFSVLKNCFLLGLLTVLSACAAYDLGGSGKYSYEVPDPDAPSWNEGIKIIVEKKCATCHTNQDHWYKPKNVPALANDTNPNYGLNNISEESFFEKTNATLVLVKKCIEATCGKDNIPMPPNYATPLSESEKKAVLKFLTNIIPATAASNLSDSFKNTCGACHGADGRSGFAKKLGDTKYTLDQFKNIIQNGKGGMQAQPNYDITKADADYAQLFK
ncbi:MAG: hypothetical protein RIR26_2011 [Pseudomonadota bacterium]